MEKSTEEHVILKNYKNLYLLTTKQLESVQQENYEALAEVLTQKQLIIDSITSIDVETLQTAETNLNQQELSKIITDTLALESKSQELLESKKSALTTKIRSVKTKELIEENYGHANPRANFLDEKI